jgi:multicomponent Na+:H+ antiporter subunit D
MPITAITFAVAALSIGGFPGFNGFVSKGMVIAAAHKKHLDVVWYLLLAGGVGTFLSFIKLGYGAFVDGEYDSPVRDANRGQSVAILLVAGLCVVYGLFPSALFAILPTSGFEYTTFTVGHVTEGLALAGIAIVGFVFLRKPLKRVGKVPDVDSLYNPAVLYGTRAVVVGVSELYAAVDRTAVTVTRLVTETLRDPEAVLARSISRDRVQLRADIGTSIVLVTLVLVGVLVLLFV